MKLFIKTLFATAVASLCFTSTAQEETCSTGMTEFAFTPQGFDSIRINPTCTLEEMFTTSQLAWTIEPTNDTVSRIYSYPQEAVKATLDDNVLLFDLKDMGTVPDKAGVVIQVPEGQLVEITVDGIMTYVRIARGFTNLLTINSLGISSVVQADLSDSLHSSLIIDTSNSMHLVTAENLNLQMSSVSSKLYITGSVLGGEYSGFANQLMVDGDVRDLSVSGNKNILASSDCSTVVVDSFSSSCVIMDAMPVDFPTIPCTFPGCETTCMSTSLGTCSCTEASCEGANSPMDEMEQGGKNDGMSAGSFVDAGVVGMVTALLAIFVSL